MNINAFIEYWVMTFKTQCEDAGIRINDPIYSDLIIREYRHAEIEYDHFISERREKPNSYDLTELMIYGTFMSRLKEVEELNIHLYSAEIFQELYLSQLKICLDSYQVTGHLRTFINQREGLIAQRSFEKRKIRGYENRGIDIRFSDSARSSLINRLIEKFEMDTYPNLYEKYESVS